MKLTLNRGTAVEETDKSAIVRKRTSAHLCERYGSGRKEMNVFYSRLCLITSLGIEYEGINYDHSPTECSALGKQEDTVYS